MSKLISAVVCWLVLISFVSAQNLAGPVRPKAETNDLPEAGEKIWGYSEVTVLAAKDLESIVKFGIDTSKIRYLAVNNYPKARRKAIWETTSFVINSLNRTNKKLIPPTVVVDSDGTLLRINLDDYGIVPKDWDNFVDNGSGPEDQRQPEPYFHIDVVKQEVAVEEEPVYTDVRETAVDGYGRTYYTGRTVRQKTATKTVEKKGSKTTVRSAAPWLPVNSISYLVEYCYTTNPIIRADWFCTYATWAPAYYDLLRIGKKEADFQEASFFDQEKSKKAKSEIRGTVVFSVVALHNRAMERSPTVSGILQGYYWKTYDFKKSFNASDVIANVLVNKADAAEIISSLPNGLQMYFLSDGAGNRLDDADTKIARDKESRYSDITVYSGRNCMTCHAQGIRPIVDRVRGLSQDKISLLVPLTETKLAKEVEDKFFSFDIDLAVKFDQKMYEVAIKGCNGLDPSVNASQFEDITCNYLDRPITLELAAMELGLTPLQFAAYLKSAVGIDHTLTAFLANKPHNITRRDQFEKRGFTQAMLMAMAAKK